MEFSFTKYLTLSNVWQTCIILTWIRQRACYWVKDQVIIGVRGKFRKRLSLISVSAQPPDNKVQTWHFLMDEVHCVHLLAWSKAHWHGLHVLKYYQSPHISLDKKAKAQHFLIDVVLNTVNRLAWSKPHWHRLIRINPDWRFLTR